jgi:hypothetical protein
MAEESPTFGFTLAILGVLLLLFAGVLAFNTASMPSHEYTLQDGGEFDNRTYHFAELSPQAQNITARLATSQPVSLIPNASSITANESSLVSQSPPEFTPTNTYYIRINGSYREVRLRRSGSMRIPEKNETQPTYSYEMGDQEIVYELSDLTDSEQRAIQEALTNDRGVATVADTSEHFSPMLDAGFPGDGIYYIHENNQYYELRVRQAGSTFDAMIQGFVAGLLFLAGGGLLVISRKFVS